MLEIYIDNTPLDLPDAFELESEESNPLFAFDSLTEGSFCYTVSIPYSPKMEITNILTKKPYPKLH